MQFYMFLCACLQLPSLHLTVRCGIFSHLCSPFPLWFPLYIPGCGDILELSFKFNIYLYVYLTSVYVPRSMYDAFFETKAQGLP